jgi:hypothetical protein
MFLHHCKEKTFNLKKTLFVSALCDYYPKKKQVSFFLYNILVRLKKMFNLKQKIAIENDKIKKNFHFILLKVNEELLRSPKRRLGNIFPQVT